MSVRSRSYRSGAWVLSAVLLAACGKDEPAVIAPPASPATTTTALPATTTGEAGRDAALPLPVAASAGSTHPELSDAMLGDAAGQAVRQPNAKDPSKTIQQLLRSAP